MQNQRAVTADRRIDEKLGETLRLRLRANKNPDAENDTDQAEKQGALIATVGSLIGCFLGALLTLMVSKVPIHIRGLLYTNHFLVVWDWRHYFWATVLAVVAVFIASYVPARRAAQLQPVDTLRGSSL